MQMIRTKFKRFDVLAVSIGTPMSVFCAQFAQAQPTIHRVVRSCETSRYGTFCGTWVWNGEYFDASWENGATAKLMVERFDENLVILTREDDAGESMGLTARYEGNPNGNAIEDGIVTGRWHWNAGRMHNQTWSWTANW
jgi:hypothetical protein